MSLFQLGSLVYENKSDDKAVKESVTGNVSPVLSTNLLCKAHACPLCLLGVERQAGKVPGYFYSPSPHLCPKDKGLFPIQLKAALQFTFIGKNVE